MTDTGTPPLAFSASGSVARVELAGDWTIDEGRELAEAVDKAVRSLGGTVKHAIVDMAGAGAMDTSGTYLLKRFIDGLDANGVSHEFANRSEAQSSLMERVTAVCPKETKPDPKPPTVADLLEEIGESVAHAGKDIGDAMTVFGRIIAGLGHAVRDPGRIRLTSVVHHIEYTGLRAVPIISLMSFLIGAIIAQQGAFQLKALGSEIYTVDLAGILILREIGVLLTAIMIAGRSGSAFTAEIGSMKMREEIDALKIIGLDTIEILVLPRVMALMIALPLLTFISDMMGLIGAIMVSWAYIDIQPSVFITRLRDAIDLSTFTVGFVKAPFMALVIGLIACVEGLRVAGSAESLGRHTTASVVKSIFMVIVLDGIFAIYFAAIDF